MFGSLDSSTVYRKIGTLVVNLKRSRKSNEEDEGNGRNLETNQRTVGLRVAPAPLPHFLPASSRSAQLSPTRVTKSVKKGGRVFSPSVARNHGEVSASFKGVSTGPCRIRPKSRNRKWFPRICREFSFNTFHPVGESTIVIIMADIAARSSIIISKGY